MRLISHRGNINGPDPDKENNPKHIEWLLNYRDPNGGFKKFIYDIEVDIWKIDDKIYLGHDEPKYEINKRFIQSHQKYLWFHIKSVQTYYWMRKTFGCRCVKYFWHQNDDFSLTSNGYLWTYPGKELTDISICVLPEQSNYTNEELKSCHGICSDFIEKYKEL